MPSPILHTTSGYIIFRLVRNRLPNTMVTCAGKIPALLLIAILFSMLPDVDSLLGLLSGNFGKYHNNVTHSFIVGLFVALISSGVISRMSSFRFRELFLVTLISYSSHVLLDFFTVGRGVLALWPVFEQRFTSPIPLFYGLHWSDGIFSIRHLWTFLTESVTAALLILAIHYLTSRNWRRDNLGGEVGRATEVSEER